MPLQSLLKFPQIRGLKQLLFRSRNNLLTHCTGRQALSFGLTCLVRSKGYLVSMDDSTKEKKEKVTREVRISKTLSYILRHGATNEGLSMRPDGYVKVDDLLSHNKLRGVTFNQLEKIVAQDKKGRYNLSYEPGQSALKAASTGDGSALWWIRANQGHSMETVEVEMTPVTEVSQCPVVVHGTNSRAWELIKVQGLSKMRRKHIHFAQGLPGAKEVISGMRQAAAILIYINLAKALEAGYEFFISQNGVILSSGNEQGYIPPEFFLRVETAWNHLPLPGYEYKGESTGRGKLDAFDRKVEKNQESLGLSKPQKGLWDDPVKDLVSTGSVFKLSS